jgi:hypothetical protein
MPEVSAESTVFAAGRDHRALVFYCARRRYPAPPWCSGAARAVTRQLDAWADAGWSTSVSSVFGDDAPPTFYLAGFAHDVDIVGMFEAPSLAEAYGGIDALTGLGWDDLFATEWSVGPREFRPVPSPTRRPLTAPWALFALWQWNDGWQGATPDERSDYDAECDVAFAADIASGVSIAGRHRFDSDSPWHHLGIWEAPTLDHITRGMVIHERVADFKFTTSRHYIGRACPAAQYLGGIT